MSQPSQGFVIVASNKKAFYVSAINLAESILDYMPDAKITLFTEKRFMDGQLDIFDQVHECTNFFRDKMYGIMNTPYDHTFYLDADCVIEHEDITTVFDQLKDNDMVFVRLTDDPVAMGSFVEKDWDGENAGTLELCGGVCLYNNTNPLVRDFMKDWYELFIKQNKGEWKPKGYPESLLRWDQFTLWWLTNKVEKYKDLKIGKFEDNYRWNWFTSFGFDSKTKKHRLVNDPPIVIHHSASMKKDMMG